jgi:hypothetical protein
VGPFKKRNPEENIQHTEHGESLKSRNISLVYLPSLNTIAKKFLRQIICCGGGIFTPPPPNYAYASTSTIEYTAVIR